MRSLVLCVSCVAMCASVASAQQKSSTTWSCAKATVSHALEAGDQPGHVYSISQATCTATTGEIDGVKQKEGVGTEFHEVTGTADRFQGTFVETLANGDKVFYKYEGTSTIKGDQFETTSHKWWSTSGTGKFKGIKSSGTCKGKSNPDGTATFLCPGEYSIAK